jgi:hypothetical protein
MKKLKKKLIKWKKFKIYENKILGYETSFFQQNGTFSDFSYCYNFFIP